MQVGVLETLDALGSTKWREFRSAEKLYDAWAPRPGTTWEAFHCVTLFASLDSLNREQVGSAPDEWYREFSGGWINHNLPAPRWLTEDTWLILDAPGWISVAMAAYLVEQRLCQPICTFDNWPHLKGVVKPELTLAALIRFAPLLATIDRDYLHGRPPVWICDNTRLGLVKGSPGQFDNRYYLDDSILPGPELLKLHGLRQVVYASPLINRSPTADLVSYFQFLMKQGIPISRVGLESTDAWRGPPVPITELANVPLNKGSFFRSTSGGFGGIVPDPSSSSG